MARRIRTTEEAAGEPVVEQVPVDGVCFINNYPNREFVTGGGVKFKFQGTRQIITDPDLIRFFTELAEQGNQRIFILATEPTAEAVADPIPEPEQIIEPTEPAVTPTE